MLPISWMFGADNMKTPFFQSMEKGVEFTANELSDYRF